MHKNEIHFLTDILQNYLNDTIILTLTDEIYWKYKSYKMLGIIIIILSFTHYI